MRSIIQDGYDEMPPTAFEGQYIIKRSKRGEKEW